MKTSAIICEYNPFHNGHKYQIDKAKEITGCDGVVALMSGNYVQRGDFSVFPKEVRALAAISGGIDLIVENPTLFTLRSAEGYASAAVYTLSRLGCIDYLVFGAECPDLDKLGKIAELFSNETDFFKNTLSEELSKGVSFPVARSKTACKLLGQWTDEILSKPNNLLAIEYIKALIKQKSHIKPVLIQRIGVEHNSNDVSNCFASASHIRGLISDNKEIKGLIPKKSLEIYNKNTAFDTKRCEKSIIASLALKSHSDIILSPDISEGLENKLKNAAMTYNTIDELISYVKSKRYAYSRLRRAVICSYLGITKEDVKLMPQYIKPLAFNETGQMILRNAKKNASLPLAKSASPILKNEAAMNIWRRELEFDRVYKLFYC